MDKGKNSDVAENLMRQRYLAVQTLQKKSPKNLSPARSPVSVRNGQTPPTQDTSRNRSEYLEVPRYNSIDISALVEEKTIHLPTTPTKNEFLFEPKEITARSTAFELNKNKAFSSDVADILASSFVENVRALGESYRDSLSSLPKTADMSKMSSVRDSFDSATENGNGNNAEKARDLWNFSSGGGFDNDWMNEKLKELSFYEDAGFKPAEEQHSKLLHDEYSFDQENAIIPGLSLKQAQQRDVSPPIPVHKLNKKNRSKERMVFPDFSPLSRSGATGSGNESDMSLGKYFNKKSDDLRGMLPGKSPPKRTPFPLIDVSNLEEPTNTGGTSKHYHDQTKSQKAWEKNADKENSYMMSVSTISKALSTLDPQDSPVTAINKMGNLQKAKSCVSNTENMKDQFKALSLGNSLENKKNFNELKNSTVNSENQLNIGLADTASFTDSFLDSSTFKRQQDELCPSPEPVQQNLNKYFASPKPKQFVEDTYRVATAEKAPLQKVFFGKETDSFAKKTSNRLQVPVVNSRKRRSSSATRQELQYNQNNENNLKRSRSPCNNAELKAVSGTRSSVQYEETPKSSLNVNKKSQMKHLSPEPRSNYGGQNNVSPFSSPKSVTSSVAFRYSPLSSGKLSLPIPTRSNSQLSSGGSVFSHRDGTVPIKSTHSELSWESIKLRKSEKKEVQIKNTSSKKLVLKLLIAGPGFQLSGPESGMMITLQAQECRTIVVDFCPTVLGPAIGVLNFVPLNETATHRVISLYGYGGDASIIVEGVQRGPIGLPFLTLGLAQQMNKPLEKSFTIFNKGNITAFARIGIDEKGVETYLSQSVKVNPQKVLIPPNSYARINVTFKPKREEITKMIQKNEEVMSVTNLHILWGDEPTRLRIKNKIQTAKVNNLQDNRVKSLKAIWDDFPNEREYSDLDAFSEINVFDTIYNLFLSFREYELTLTVNRTLDQTMVDFSLEDSASVLFRSMCSVSSSDGGTSNRDFDISPATYTNHRDSGESWSIHPTFLEFRAGVPHPKQFVIKSRFFKPQFFELNSNYRQMFTFSPEEGQIQPGQEITVTVDMNQMSPTQTHTQKPIHVIVYVENEKITIPVYVKRDGLTPLFSR